MLTARGSFLGEQAVQSVIETLHAAAVDRGGAAGRRGGRLARPLRLAGLGAIPSAPAAKRPDAHAALMPWRSPRRRRAPEPDAAAQREAARAERERAKDLARARASAERAVGAGRARARLRRRPCRPPAAPTLAEAEAELARLDEDLAAAREELDDA